MKKTILVIFAILLVNSAIQAQKLPRILRPKQGQPTQQTQPQGQPSGDQAQTQPESNQRKAAPVSAPARQGVIDDAFSWFEAGNGEALGPNNIPVSTGWYLKSWVRVFGEYPNRSAIKLVVSKAGKQIAMTRCETGFYHNTNGALDESYMVTGDCGRKDTSTKEIGVFDLQVFTVNGDTDEEKLVRTYKIDIRTVNRVPVGQGAGIAPPQYYINRHNDTAVSWVFLRPREYYGYLDWRNGSDRDGANEVEFYFSISPTDDIGKTLPLGYMRCSVNGKRIQMPGPPDFADQAINRRKNFYDAIHQDRIAPRFKTGTEYRDEIGFHMVRLLAPLTWGERANRWAERPALEDNPGKWECSLMNTGEVWRTWRFTVGSDGRPAPLGEQQGSVNLAFNSYLVDMEIPAAGSPLDKRLAGPSTGLFYGLSWTSVEGKAMAARLPKKGNPFPVPSNSANAAKQWYDK